MNEFREQFSERIPDDELDRLEKIAGGDPAKFRRFAQARLFKVSFAYLEGHIEFMGRRFRVDPRTYVSTPETEQLVQLVIDENPASVLDIGVGAGTIGITIDLECPDTLVTGAELTPYALEVARLNASILNSNINLQESFYVDDVRMNEPTHVVADLPWGQEDAYELDSNDIEEMRNMPATAIFPPDGPMDAYVELVESIQRRGWHPRLFIETGNMDEPLVRKALPDTVTAKYVQFKNYSVTIIEFS